MSSVRVLVGTKKGAFVLTSDERRRDWKVEGPHFAGWEIHHVTGSPANPDRLYAAQSGGWFGQLIQRSDDGGQTWEPVGNDFAYQSDTGIHLWYDGTLARGSSRRCGIWSRRKPIPTRCMPESKTRPSIAAPTPARAGPS